MAEGFFLPGDTNDPRVNQALRQRIALQMMQPRKAFPRTLGEGLTALGDSLGEIGMARRLEQSDIAAQTQTPPLPWSPQAASPGPGPRSDASSAKPISYAPTDDTVTAAPAVKAINAAVSDTPDTPVQPGPDLLTTPETQPASMLSPSMPTGLGGPAPPSSPAQNASYLSPQPMLPPSARVGGGGPADGGYNSIDAQAGLPLSRTTPGYLQDAIARTTQNPDMQAYLGTLSAAEAPKGPSDVSPTGASGPFQFTRGTGRQYGLVGPGGDQRANVDASTQAALKFTQDNADLFQRINGRAPTMAELAVMHQQGGQTGASMIAGTGNAPPINLARNNIPMGASPAQAVARIKNFYGMPDRAVDPRATIAATLMARPGVPLPNPTPAGVTPPASSIPVVAQSTPQEDGGPPDQRLALADTGTPEAGPIVPSNLRGPALPPGAIQPAPPLPSGIQSAPQNLQLAQAQQLPQPGYVPPEPAAIAPPQQIPPTDLEMQAMQNKLIFAGNPYRVAREDAIIAYEEQKRQFQQNQLNDIYKRQMDEAAAMRTKRQDLLSTAPQRAADVEKARGEIARQQIDLGALPEQRAQEAATRQQAIVTGAQDVADRTRFGEKPEAFFEQMNKDKAVATQASAALDANRLASSAIKAGVITGPQANPRINAAAMKAWMFNNKREGDLASNTQILQAALANATGAAARDIQGQPSGRVAPAILELAKQATSDPNMELGTIQKLLETSNGINSRTLNDYEDKVHNYLSGHPAENRYQIPVGETASVRGPNGENPTQDLIANPDATHIRFYNNRFGEGSAQLEIARAARRAARGR